MRKRGIGANMLIQGLYQFVILGVPLVISPYLTRTLGSEELGVYTYSQSIAYYFVVAAMLGINRHGQRAISSAVGDETALRKTFWSLYSVHAGCSLLAAAAYAVFLLLADVANKHIFAIQMLYVLSALFDITWLFYGLENFLSVVIKNAAIKAVELVCIFSFVKSSADTAIYTFIMAGSVLAGQISLLPSAVRMVRPIRFSWEDAKEHIKPLLVLSISVIAVSLYTVFDKTLLGLMLDMSSVSYYEYSDRIIGVPKALLGVISTVLFPRVCRLAQNDENRLKSVFDYSFLATAVLGIGVTAVLAGVAKTFAPLYYGEDFAICGSVIICLAPVIIVISLGDIIRTQLMISKKKDTQYIFCVIMNAIVNLVLSVALIRVIGIYGTVVGTLGAEICGLVLESFFCRGDLVLKKMIKNTLPFLAFGTGAMAVGWLAQCFGELSWGRLVVQIIASGVVYVVLTIGYFLLFRKDIVCKVKLLRVGQTNDE